VFDAVTLPPLDVAGKLKEHPPDVPPVAPQALALQLEPLNVEPAAHAATQLEPFQLGRPAGQAQLEPFQTVLLLQMLTHVCVVVFH
jgi:hypothetical protein